jgi:hypothetical protein
LFICWYLLVLSWIKCYIISNERLFICVDFRCVANHIQMRLEKKIVVSPYLPTLPSPAQTTKFRKSPACRSAPAFGYLNPHSYFSGFFITVNRSKQTMGDHLKTLASSFHVRFISNRKSFLPCQLQQERGLCLDQAAV